jgi:hypothetical protein
LPKPTWASCWRAGGGLDRPTALSLGFSFLPLDKKNLDKVVGARRGDTVEGFDYLSSELIDVLCQSSRSGDFAYIETEYSGGDGAQGAAVFQGGRVTFGPKGAEIGPINEALAMLGVASGDPPNDAFERVGLAQWRSNNAIRKTPQLPLPARRSGRLPLVIWGLMAIVVLVVAVAVAAVIAANAGIDFRLPVFH